MIYTYCLKNCFSIVFSILLITTIEAHAQSRIYGQLDIDTTWERVVYLSLIPSFDQLNSMSNQMIIESSKVDETGQFMFDTEYLSAENNLYRIHLSKIGDPPASLIIGGKDENYIFFIANNKSDITINSFDTTALFEILEIKNSPQTTLLCEVNKMLLYVDTTNFYNTPLKRELMENAMDEKLRQFADTCSYPLVALYAIYKSNFEDHIKSNSDFYNRFLKKWNNEKSPYFKKFREAIPIKKNINYSSVIFSILGFGIGILLMTFMFKRKTKTAKNQLQDLTIQERNIFGLLQQGKSNKEISDVLNISLSTVKSHVNNIFSKLKIKSRKEIINTLAQTETAMDIKNQLKPQG